MKYTVCLFPHLFQLVAKVRTRMVTSNFKSYTFESYGFILKSQWIRAYGSAMPCCNDSEKDGFRILENEREKMEKCAKREMYMKITVPVLI